VSFLKDEKTALAPAIIGGAGAVCLFSLKLKFDSDIQRQAAGILQVDYDVGFWLVLLMYLAAVALNVSIFLQSRNKATQMQALSPAHATAPLASAVGPPSPTVVQTAAAAASTPSYGNLQCTTGPFVGRRFEVTRRGLLIGRDPGTAEMCHQGWPIALWDHDCLVRKLRDPAHFGIDPADASEAGSKRQGQTIRLERGFNANLSWGRYPAVARMFLRHAKTEIGNWSLFPLIPCRPLSSGFTFGWRLGDSSTKVLFGSPARISTLVPDNYNPARN
jgi:hypothetical protein